MEEVLFKIIYSLAGSIFVLIGGFVWYVKKKNNNGNSVKKANCEVIDNRLKEIEKDVKNLTQSLEKHKNSIYEKVNRLDREVAVLNSKVK